jgi:hypothetical protein
MTSSSSAVRLAFLDRADGPEELVCDVEILLEDVGPLSGMKLVGCSIWRKTPDEMEVRLPARRMAKGAGRFFDLLRATDGNGNKVAGVKGWILEEYDRHRRARGHEAPGSKGLGELGRALHGRGGGQGTPER